MATTANIASKVRPRLSNGSPRKASWQFPETSVRKQPTGAIPSRPPSKGPVRRTILPKVECARRFRCFCALCCVRDTAHELGHQLGFGSFAASDLALADVSDVADAG